MNLSSKADNIYRSISDNSTKLGDLRKIAKEIKKDHDLALELWATGELLPRLLSILIMDKEQLSIQSIDQFVEDIQSHNFEERNQLIDWFMANQLTKVKKIIGLIESWENEPSPLKRRVFWYYQARLRWMGNMNHSNTQELLDSIKARILDEQPEVQWAMNYAAAWIGVYDEGKRALCISIGEKTGLYRDEVVAKNCTPSYLPEFIRIEVEKRKNKN